MTHDAGAARPAGSARPVMGVGRAMLVLGLLEAFGPLSMDLYLPSLPQLATSLGTSDALAQATMSVCMIGLGLGQLVAGPLSDRFGRRRPLLVGVALFTALSLVCVVAPSIEVLLLARFLQGLAGSAGIVICLAVARDLYSGAELSRMLSLLMLVSASAPIVAPVIGGQLALVMDWRGIFGVLGGVGAVLFVLALTLMRETLPPERRHGGGFAASGRHLGALARDGLFLAVLGASAAGGVAFFAYLSMSSFVLQDEFGLSPQLFSLCFAANAVANMAGAQLSRVLVRRTGPARMYLLGLSVTAACALLLLGGAIAGVALWVILALGLFLSSVGVGGPNGSTLALSAHGDRAGTASAVLGTAQFTVGPIVAPLASLTGATALAMGSTIAAGALVALALGWAVVFPVLRRRGALAP